MNDLDGNPVKLSDFRGQVVLLNFWATGAATAGPSSLCSRHAYERNQKEGFVVLAINIQENKERVSELAHEMGLTFPVLLDRRGERDGQLSRPRAADQLSCRPRGHHPGKTHRAGNRIMLDEYLAQAGIQVGLKWNNKQAGPR